MEAISIINVLNQPEFSDTVTSDYEGVDPNQAVEFSQILVNGHKSGRTRIVPMGFRCDADNLEENSDSESSIMTDLVTLSSSESEYFYSDGDIDYDTQSTEDHDDDDGIGIRVTDSIIDSNVDAVEDFEIFEVPTTDDEYSDAHCKSWRMVVDLSQDSDEESTVTDQDVIPIPNDQVWLQPNQIIQRDSLETRPVQNNIFQDLNNSGLFAEEIMRYIRHSVDACQAMEAADVIGQVANRRPKRRDSSRSMSNLLVQLYDYTQKIMQLIQRIRQ